jgi:hypothetical protein
MHVRSKVTLAFWFREVATLDSTLNLTVSRNRSCAGNAHVANARRSTLRLGFHFIGFDDRYSSLRVARAILSLSSYRIATGLIGTIVVRTAPSLLHHSLAKTEKRI